MSAYYLLGYYSTNTKFDGRVRNIQVRMKTPGLAVRARRSYVAPNEAALKAEASPARAAAATEGMDEALGVLARLRPGSDLFVSGIQEREAAFVTVELSSALASNSTWNRGADVQLSLTGPGGESVATADGRIEANTRGTLVRIPLTAPLSAPVRVTVRIRSGTAGLEEPAELRQSSGKLVGDPLLFRSSPAASAPLRPGRRFPVPANGTRSRGMAGTRDPRSPGCATPGPQRSTTGSDP